MALDRTPTADRLESRITGFQNSADYQRSADPPTSADSQEEIQSPLHQFCPSFAFGRVNLVLGKNSVKKICHKLKFSNYLSLQSSSVVGHRYFKL